MNGDRAGSLSTIPSLICSPGAGGGRWHPLVLKIPGPGTLYFGRGGFQSACDGCIDSAMGKSLPLEQALG